MTAPDAMPERVKRYEPDERAEGGVCMVPSEYGLWVDIDDYAALESRLLAAEARVREVEAERDANHADYLAKVRDNLALRAEVARLTDALGLCGVNAGSVNGVPKWWHVAADGSEPIHDTVEEAANAVWAVREAITAERDALVQALADADVLVGHYEGYAVTAAIRANVTDLRVGVKPEILAAGERYRVRREGQARAILAREET